LKGSVGDFGLPPRPAAENEASLSIFEKAGFKIMLDRMTFRSYRLLWEGGTPMNKEHGTIMIRMLMCAAFGGAALVAQQPSLPVESLSTQPDQCFTSGSGGDYMKFCISRHGNLVLFESPAGREHIRRGTILEGYNLCYYPDSEPIDYYDFGYDESWNWQEPYKFQQPGGPGTLPYTIYRKTKDGKLELVQTFTRNSSEREIVLKMAVYNRSPRTLREVWLSRSVDFDVNNTPGGDVFLATERSFIAYDGDLKPGVSVTMTPGVSVTEPSAALLPAVYDFPEWQQGAGSCSFSFWVPTFTPTPPGDYVGVIRYWFLTIPPGASRSVTLIYRAL
jgi:hypothetical protein